jgi:hypothetical protein
MKELCTDGTVTSSRDVLLQNLKNNTIVDFDGYEISSDLFRDLERQPIPDVLKQVRKGLAVSVSMTGKTTKTVQEICSRNPEMKQVTIKMELFWNKVDDVDSDELISVVCKYVKKHCK